MRIFNKISDATIPAPPTGKLTLYTDDYGQLSLKDHLNNIHKFPKPSINVSYAELINLVETSQLVVGVNYIITDYRTTHIIPGTVDINVGDIEPLIVTPVNEHILSPIASSTIWPGDIIYYSIDTDETNFPGATTGYIKRRIDTINNNNIGSDWRTCKYRRYKISQANWDAATLYSKFEAVKRSSGTATQQEWIYVSLKDDNINHPVTDTMWWKRFEFKNDTYSGMTPNGWWVINDEDESYTACNINTTAEYEDRLLCTANAIDIQNNYIAGDMLYNTTVTQLNETEIYGSFKDNTLYSLYRTVIQSEFRKNSCGPINNCNISGGSFSFNSIGTNFDSNSVMCENFIYNIIGTTFHLNELTKSSALFVQNVISSNFSQNTITGSFFSNAVSYGFFRNRIFGQFSGNIIPGNFQTNILYSDFIDCTSVGLNVKNNIFQYKQFVGYSLPDGLTKTTNGTRVYRAFLSQTGTSAPQATVLENTFGITLDLYRESPGIYTISAADALPHSQTFVNFVRNPTTMSEKSTAYYSYEDQVIVINSYNNSNVLSDNVLSDEDDYNKSTIEIYVYYP